jgi:ribonuclease BN (tRNA processing enzyme)
VGLQITVLGKSPSWQDAGGACSGYLVEDDGARVLLDCGNGVFAKLRSRVQYTAVDAVVISHLHADHFLDVVPFAYALIYSPARTPDYPRPALHAPSGAREVFRRVVGAWGSEDLIESAFDLHEYDPADTLEIGPLRVRFSEVPHFLQTCAVEFTGADGSGRFTFGADTGPAPTLIEFARGTDLLLVEATLTQPEDDGRRGHLTPAEAGEHGRLAGARRLVLTHISDELDPEWARREAESAFGGPVDVAAEGAVYEV